MSDLAEISKLSTSVKGLIWQEVEYNERDANYITQNYKLPHLISQIIASRVEINEVENFLKPTLKNDLPDPFSLIDMDKATARIAKALAENHTIGVLGDYDVDGATSSALLVRYFKHFSKDVIVYIPDRLKEGYGPSKKAFDEFKKNNTDLVIIVDSGTVAFEALDYAGSLGIEVIVLDHHVGIEKLPRAVAIVNPNRIDEKSPHKNLAAVGVTFLMLVGLNNILKKTNETLPNLLDFLDLVALGTVCDVMKLTSVNRAFVTQGLKVIKQRKNLGIRNIIDKTGLSEEPSTYHLGFVIGPRINAGGRVGESNLGYKLLSSNDELETIDICQKLEIYNNERKSIESQLLEDASAQAEKQLDSMIIIIRGKNWHPGVIGIIAARIKEKFNKAVAVVTLRDGIGTASCRSINGLDFGLLVTLAKQEGLLVAGGGHKMAAGFTVLEENLEKLMEFFKKHSNFSNDEIQTFNTKYYDKLVSVGALNLEIARHLKVLEPIGNGNPQPKFMLNRVNISNATMFTEKHFRCLISDELYDGKFINCIAFNIGNSELQNFLMKNPKIVNVIGNLQINNWQNTEKLQFVIDDAVLG